MKMWSLCLISIGCVLIMLSYQVESPISLIVSGIALVIVGAVGTFKDKKNKQNVRK